MNIYLLTRTEDVNWDEAAGFVVVARNSGHARQIVSRLPSSERGPGDEGPSLWLLASQAKCEEIGVANPCEEGVILRDFRAG